MLTCRRAATEPITLAKCLESFTQEEQLGEGEKYYCAGCQSHQLAVKKLQIWRLPPILIIHLKRFQCVNSRWIKSHKIVDFPLAGLEPTVRTTSLLCCDLYFTHQDYLAAVPAATLTRHRELLRGRAAPLLAGPSVPPIQENSEPSSLTELQAAVRQVSLLLVSGDVDGHENRRVQVLAILQFAPSVQASLTEVDLCLGEDGEDPNDSGIESGGCGGRGHPTLERGSSTASEVFTVDTDLGAGQGAGQGRTRQISTSLTKDPVIDDNLQDFHGHLLEPGRDSLDIKYSMYAMVCHSGVLGGGHYVSYSKTGPGGKWFCHNDSACKEVPEKSIDKSSAYILMYEREGLSLTDYMPDTAGLKADTGDLDEEFDLDFKKQCVVM